MKTSDRLSWEDSREGRTMVPPLAFMAAASVMLGIVFRASDLTRTSLWLDEVLTYHRAEMSLGDLVGDLKRSPFPPLYYLLLWVWTRIWGLSDYSLRSLPMCLGLAGMLAAYSCWKGLIGSRPSTWLVCLVSLNAFHVFYSRDAKMYAAVWLLSSVSCAAYLHLATRDDGRLFWSGVYAASGLSLLLTSYIGLAPLAVQAVHGFGLVVFSRSCRHRVLRAAAVAGCSLLPCIAWLPIALRAASTREGIAWIPPARPERAAKDLYDLFGILLFGFRMTFRADPHVYLNIFMLLYFIILINVTILASITVVRSASDVGAACEDETGDVDPAVMSFLGMWSIVPVLGCLAFSLLVYPLWGVPRYLSTVSPALIILTALALSGSRLIGPLIGLAVLALNVFTIVFERTHCTQTPWREAAAAICQAAPLLNEAPEADGPYRVPICLAAVAESYEELPLKHYLEHPPKGVPAVDPALTPLSEAAARGEPFLVVGAISGTDPTGVPAPRDFDAYGADYEFVNIYARAVHSTGECPLPGLFGTHGFGVWAGLPKGWRSRLLEVRSGGSSYFRPARGP